MRCMQTNGLSYVEAPAHHYDRVKHDGLSNKPGVAPAEKTLLMDVRINGYGLYEMAVAASTLRLRNDEYARSLSPVAREQYQAVLTGSVAQHAQVRLATGNVVTYPTEGCVGAAGARVWGSAREAALGQFEPGGIARQVEGAALERPSVRAALSRWSRCVEVRTGKTFPDPGGLKGWLQARYAETGPKPSTRMLERRYASVATRCVYASGLATSYPEEFLQAAERMPAAQYRELTRLALSSDIALQNARAIVARIR